MFYKSRIHAERTDRQAHGVLNFHILIENKLRTAAADIDKQTALQINRSGSADKVVFGFLRTAQQRNRNTGAVLNFRNGRLAVGNIAQRCRSKDAHLGNAQFFCQKIEAVQDIAGTVYTFRRHHSVFNKRSQLRHFLFIEKSARSASFHLINNQTHRI